MRLPVAAKIALVNAGANGGSNADQHGVRQAGSGDEEAMVEAELWIGQQTGLERLRLRDADLQTQGPERGVVCDSDGCDVVDVEGMIDVETMQARFAERANPRARPSTRPRCAASRVPQAVEALHRSRILRVTNKWQPRRRCGD
jgi:hypothetical protein